MTSSPHSVSLRPGHPDFLDLPWDRPLDHWQDHTPRLVEVDRGISRHSVVFANYNGVVYALKELPPGLAEKEYNLLRQFEELRLPAVIPVGHAEARPDESSVLITRYLEHSLPYLTLFKRPGLKRYRQHLVDGLASLLVQLHIAGVFWGDCSLSNALFRQDAGALQAYLVDAETAELWPRLSPPLRYHDLEIMEENITYGLADLAAAGELPADFPLYDTAPTIRRRYQALWQEITHTEVISPNEHWRIQARVKALNDLGFSVSEIELQAAEDGQQLNLKAFVTDRNYHRAQLHSLTVLEAEEMQARQIINEINELKATLSQQHNRSTPLSVAAYHWLNHYFTPIKEQLKPLMHPAADPVELYCQMLEHKWYLSEQAQKDVGHQAAVQDYLKNFAGQGKKAHTP